MHLTADGSLTLHLARSLLPLAEAWLPRLGPAPRPGCPRGARIEVAPGPFASGPPPAATPLLRLATVSAWPQGEEGQIGLLGSGGGCGGEIDLRRRRARIRVRPEAGSTEPIAADLYSMLTLSAALLLNRLGRALVHAAAVVGPDGRAWLLVGDTHAGKTTTCLNLILSGWSYLADDHVVLAAGDPSAPVWVEGWPRAFHLDAGWEGGVPSGRRVAVDPERLAPGRGRRAAPLAGLLFPRVDCDAPTRLLPLSPGEALTWLIRQTPWLLADPRAAPRVLDLLRRSATHPGHELRLGLDTYRDARRLLMVFAPLVERTP